MLKSLIGKAVSVVDDAGVETVLTLAFVAQFAAYALPLHGIDAARAYLLPDESDIVVIGTVVQMPAKPSSARAARTVVVRESKGVARTPTAAAPKAARVRRPDPVDDELGAEELDQLRAAEGAVRITIIGPDGQPRTKIVRLSGSRAGMAAPARRPHD
ncbi:MAG: hypothetical protein M3282_04740 [Gemmatimonadota bacterium]|nr:hypothetical protein [Gemmatimonadota bacterium]